MERCLKKLLLEAGPRVLGGREKGGWEPMALSEEKLCSVGCKWMYTFNRREAKKLIPVVYFQKIGNSKWESRFK